MLPSQAGKASEVRVRGHHRAAVLDRYSWVLRVGYQLPNSPYVATKLLEDCRVVGTRADDASVRTIREFPREGEHLVDARGSGKNATVGYDAGEPRQR